MKYAAFAALALPALASAHRAKFRRDATTTTSADADNSAAVSAAEAGATSTGTLPDSITFSLASTNPTALPLSEIATGTAQTQSTIAISTTYATGSKPTQIPNAPALPDAIALIPTNYPTLDKTPPTDSTMVQEWVKQVMNSGVEIPDIPVTNPGGCSNNTAAVANASETCWWTCGGCVRETDIQYCPTQNHWGVSYDDGPSPYTPNLLQYFDQQDIRSTFFVVGSRAISRPAMLQDEYMMGNQIAVHTWSHPYMTTRTNEEVIAELGWTKKIIHDALGVTPIYWRPPYGDIDDRVRAISTAMNLTPIIWTRISATMTFDTTDWSIVGGTANVYSVLDKWQEIMGNSTNIDTGFIVLEHDLFEQTVDMATGYILPQALAHEPKYNMTPIIECLDMPLANSYVETNDNTSNPLPLVAYLANHTVSVSSSASKATQTTSGTGSASGSASSGSGSGGSDAQSSDAMSIMSVSPALLTAAIGVLAGACTLFL
ncbi:carbohydrate esterase family 4 protein [Laetiporus sulphureus 93-53]|uniref:chitin deacetylase n=1 Tax=Laetiporus sulphureus 93-53 TaxID=1314785 RepID=A0A165E696_9APHY|nr:carbohydrate esterase family 4 protein [Laetiporus sulphureus 93-53]KZT06317.1 carbohydrate esterase family 4 protein [Laetiporus sulphureus 93-53]